MSIPVIGLIDKAFDLASEFIEDPDKKNEIQAALAQSRNELIALFVTSKTHPVVDGIVKIIFALVALARPLGTAAMTAFGLYCHWKGVAIEPAVHAAIDGAFPAWGASRHIEKSKRAAAGQPPPELDPTPENIRMARSGPRNRR